MIIFIILLDSEKLHNYSEYVENARTLSIQRNNEGSSRYRGIFN